MTLETPPTRGHHQRTLAINCSTYLGGRPIPERLRRAAGAGFTAVEFWWPFADAEPSRAELEGFIDAVQSSGMALVAMNLFAGDLGAGDRGILSWPGREDELLASANLAAQIGARLGTARFNVLYGNRIADLEADAQDAAANHCLREVARVLADVNGVAMVEALSGAPAYPLTSVADAAAVVTRVTADAGPANVGILLDLYHLAANGDDLTQAIEVYGPNAAHVQLADLPGRGVPGSGTLPLAAHVARLRALGYDGWIALEYPDADGASVMHLTDDDRKALA